MDILYDRYSNALFGVTEKIVRDALLAEDVLQEAFVKIWLNGENYDPSKGRLFTWMLNITRNLALDKLKSKQFKQNAQTSGQEELTNVAESSQHLNIGEETIGLRELVEKLPADQKRLIDLMYFQGYTQAEIAEELNMPLGSVKTKIRTAMMQLRKYYGVEMAVLIAMLKSLQV